MNQRDIKQLKFIKRIGNIIILIVILGFWTFVLYPDFDLSVIFSDVSPFTAGVFVLLGFNMFFIPFMEKVLNKELPLQTLKEIPWFNIIFLFFTVILVGLLIEGLPHIYIWEINDSPMGYRSDKWDLAIVMGVVMFLVNGFRIQRNLSLRVNKLERILKK
ncbi:hypothetical protein LCGC14_1899360 [marine sediment metagenome]|uniref:Uncharacterized protein n=1 Tax=marine sediment metagenome TaxID=412755 RepID=A0A0F9IAZ1_9ZZZZ